MGAKMYFVVGCIVAALFHPGHSDDFNYSELDKWGGDCQTGKRQSPIDLTMKQAKYLHVSPMYFLKYDEKAHFEVQNNGHSIKIKFDQPCGYSIVGGELPDVYILDHIHFHKRSEHLIDGKRMPMEAHFVHYRRDFKSVGEASNQPNGLAVLGVLFEKSTTENTVLRDLLPYFGNQSDTWQIPKYHLAPMSLLPRYKSSFFRYSGSLTTPTCSESVIWTVFRDRLPISQSQIEQLDKVMFRQDKENFRPIQKLNKRPLFIMTYNDKIKQPLNCAKQAKSDQSLCFLLALAGIAPAMRI